MRRWRKNTLIVATLAGAWLGMQQVHELGHCVGAWLTGGRVERVVLPFVGFSRTDLAESPRPLVVAWAGPVVRVLLPVAAWLLAEWLQFSGAFLLRFFAGVCLLANGVYIGIRSFDRVGDCGDLLRHGAHGWQLWLFGFITAPMGLSLWHGLGRRFGLGRDCDEVPRAVVYGSVVACIAVLMIALLVGGE